MAVLKLHTQIVDEQTRNLNLVFSGMNGTSFETVDAFIDSILPDDDTIEIRINCIGGDVMEGWAIYDKLRMSGKKIFAVIEGKCASIASVILLAAPLENRSGYKNSSLLIHKPFFSPCNVSLRANELRKMADELEYNTNKIINLYMERTGNDEATLRSIMDRDKYISMEEAKELGFISEIKMPISSADDYHLKINNMAKTETDKVEVKKSFFDKLLSKCGYARIEDAENALNVLAMDLATVEGNTLTIEREEGDPQVGDKASPDGEHLMPDGTTIVVVDGVIAEIKNPKNPDENENEELAQAKARIQELEQEIALLRPQAKSQEELVILNKVKIMGGMEGLRKIASKYVPDGRGFVENRDTSASSQEPVSLVEKRLAERQEALKKKFNK